MSAWSWLGGALVAGAVYAVVMKVFSPKQQRRPNGA